MPRRQGAGSVEALGRAGCWGGLASPTGVPQHRPGRRLCAPRAGSRDACSPEPSRCTRADTPEAGDPKTGASWRASPGRPRSCFKCVSEQGLLCLALSWTRLLCSLVASEDKVIYIFREEAKRNFCSPEAFSQAPPCPYLGRTSRWAERMCRAPQTPASRALPALAIHPPHPAPHRVTATPSQPVPRQLHQGGQATVATTCSLLTRPSPAWRSFSAAPAPRPSSAFPAQPAARIPRHQRPPRTTPGSAGSVCGAARPPGSPRSGQSRWRRARPLRQCCRHT